MHVQFGGRTLAPPAAAVRWDTKHSGGDAAACLAPLLVRMFLHCIALLCFALLRRCCLLCLVVVCSRKPFLGFPVFSIPQGTPGFLGRAGRSHRMHPLVCTNEIASLSHPSPKQRLSAWNQGGMIRQVKKRSLARVVVAIHMATQTAVPVN